MISRFYGAMRTRKISCEPWSKSISPQPKRWWRLCSVTNATNSYEDNFSASGLSSTNVGPTARRQLSAGSWWASCSRRGSSSPKPASPHVSPEYYPADDYSSASSAAADASADAAAAADAATAQSFHAPSDPYAALDAEPDVDPYATPPASLPSPPVNAVTPSAGAGPLYSQYEIESCLEEEAILNRLRNMISSDGAIDRFNARINRYNIRCGAYQYRLDDMTRAQSAISGRSAAVSTEAKRLADEWSYD